MAIDWKKIEKAVLEAADIELHKGADIFISEAKSRAPVNTGALRGGIGKKSKQKLQVEVTAGKFYGFFHEYGTHKMKPQPYMRPAFDNKSVIVADRIEKNLVAVVDKLNNEVK